jgi:peptidoglycan hydrolase-like protein with peptidoglycan-binding domain
MKITKHIMLTLALGVFFIIPFSANGQTTAELQAQAAALLARLNELQAKLNQQLTQQTTNTSGSKVLSGGFALYGALERGDRGEDVSRLQAFLASDVSIYPEGLVTGNYFSLTEAAVKRFQVACGIVSAGDYQSTGYGRVGPLTRKALLSGCGSNASSVPTSGVVGGLIRVSPSAGPAPLTVTVAATVNTSRSCDYAVYTLDFGDGTTPAQINVPAGRCTELNQSITHTFYNPGTYNVLLRIGTHYATTKVTVGSNTTTNTNNITNFSTCLNTAGAIVNNTNPRQCTVGGITHIESTSNTSYTTGFSACLAISGAIVTNTNPRLCTIGGVTYSESQTSDGATFNSCLTTNGSVVTNSNPRQCRLPDGRSFLESTTSGSVDPQLATTPGYDGVLERVRVTFSMTSTCVPFTLNWGDGSTSATRLQGSFNCGGTEQLSYTHTYPTTSGSKQYNITLTYGPSGSQQSKTASVVITSP